VESLLPILAFVFGSLIVAGAALLFMPGKAVAIDRRLEELMPGREAQATPEKRPMKTLVAVFKRVGEKAPRSPKELGALRLRLVQAGFRRDEAVTIFFGIRITFALALFALFATSIVTRPNITLALGGVGFGYVFPGMVLARLA
jgi:hypothetical protein